MSLTNVQKRVVAEAFGLVNVEQIWIQAARVELPFYIACAIMEKESGGRNVYGHDEGGALSGFPEGVNRSNFAVFRWLVFDRGQQSNGVGPAQITFKGHFSVMEAEGLKPWNVADNLFYGFRLFKNYLVDADGSIAIAGKWYNGSSEYGIDLANKAAAWKKRLS